MSGTPIYNHKALYKNKNTKNYTTYTYMVLPVQEIINDMLIFMLRHLL